MALRAPLLPAFAASLLVLLAGLASVAVGTAGIGATLALAAGLALLAQPVWALGVALALPVLVETEPDWGPSASPARIYELIPGTKIDPLELLVLLALAAALLDRRARRLPLLGLGWLTVPVGLLGLALVAGAITGSDAGVGPTTLVNAARSPALALVVPLVVVQVVGTRVALTTVLAAGLALAGIKGVAGVAALATGETAATLGERALTYYYPTANALMMLGLLFCAAAALRRVALPAWAWAAVPFMAAALLLSYRRSFWIATVLGLVLVALFARGRSGRRLGVVAVVAGTLALALTLGGGGLTGGLAPPTAQGGSGLSARLRTLSPTAIAESKDDRYRLEERRNVLAELRGAPVAGLGLGVGYRARYPLSIGDIDHEYVHFAALWWWMHCGVLGLVGYVWLIAAAVWTGARVFRGHPDPRVATAGLAAAAGLAGYAVAETTATFTGPDPRACVLIGAVVGLLAVADRERRAATAAARAVA